MFLYVNFLLCVFMYWLPPLLSSSSGSVYKCAVHWCARDIKPDLLRGRCKLFNWCGELALPSLPGQRTLTTLTGWVTQPQSQHRYSVTVCMDRDTLTVSIWTPIYRLLTLFRIIHYFNNEFLIEYSIHIPVYMLQGIVSCHYVHYAITLLLFKFNSGSNILQIMLLYNILLEELNAHTIFLDVSLLDHVA